MPSPESAHTGQPSLSILPVRFPLFFSSHPISPISYPREKNPRNANSLFLAVSPSDMFLGAQGVENLNIYPITLQQNNG
jgi:hypothetical protein